MALFRYESARSELNARLLPQGELALVEDKVRTQAAALDQGLSEDERNFAQYRDEVMGSLPLVVEGEAVEEIERGENLPAELHVATNQLAEMLERAAENPALKPGALAFFIDCAASDGVSLAIRAVCYKYARDLNRDLHKRELQLIIDNPQVQRLVDSME